MSGPVRNMGAGLGPRWRLALWGGAALTLLLPLVAMRFSGEVAWDAADFVLFGAMLVLACGAFEGVARLARDAAYRAAVGVALAAAFLLVWLNLAVGLIGSEDNPANLMFGAVLAVAVGGAAAVRLRAHAMARVMALTALVQVSVAVIALAAGMGNGVLLSGLFAALWLVAAALFRKAARQEVPAAP